MPNSTLQQQIGKQHPFDLPQEEAYLNIIRTSALLSSRFHKLFKSHGLSESAYNVLRILRGSGPEGRPSQRITPDMVALVPDVTRLVDRLEASQLAVRTRSKHDRRVVNVAITEKGLQLLADLDAPVRDLHLQQLGHMTNEQLDAISTLLSNARNQD